MKSLLQFALCLGISVPRCLAAQEEPEGPASGLALKFALNRLFGTNACTAEAFTKVSSAAGRMALSENFALLDGNVRIELGSSQFTNAHLSQVDAFNYSLDKVTIFRPDLRLCYTIFPQLKTYVVARARTNSTASNDVVSIRMEERGQEELEGHPCVKRLAILGGASGTKREVLCWFARDLKNFPIRIRFTEGEQLEQLETTTYRNVKFAPVDRSMFEPPRDFTFCLNQEEFMKRLEKGELGAPVISNKTYGEEESMAELIKFTLRSGSNSQVGSNTAKAFGLQSGPVPSTQIALGFKDDPVVRMFSISQMNSNDLFFAQIDQTTRAGTVWLASPLGKLRAAIKISTNAPLKTLPIESQREVYEEVRAAFFSASEED